MPNEFPRREAPTLSPCLPPWWHSPSALDREADMQLALGRHIAAERLAERAAELREVGR